MLGFSSIKLLLPLWMAFGLALGIPVSAAPKAAPVRTITFHKESAAPTPLLDTTLIRKLYLGGDFDQAIEILETGLKEKSGFNHMDSVFMFKHLGVMYAAKYDTREKGKYYMHQLLLVEPTARILDMYASDMIYMIFKNIQDEFDQASGRLARAEGHVNGNSQTSPADNQAPGNQTSGSQDSKKASAASGHKTLYWVGATGVAVAAGVTAYFLMADQSSEVVDHSVK